MSELTVIEIKPEQAPTLYIANGLSDYLEQIRQAVNEVPDLSTKKGRDRIASLAAQVSRSKTAIEKPGRDYLKRLKASVKPAEAEIKRFVDACDALRDATRRPLTEWEAEQDRLNALAEMNAMHTDALEMNAEFDRQHAARIEADHEMALLMNNAFDRNREDQIRLAEQAQREHDEQLKREAEARVRADAEARARAEIEAAQRREAEARAAKERAERERIETEQRADREKREASERAEREKQEAIATERRRQEAAEAQRLAEAKRIADEESRRTADIEHRRTVNRRVIADLIAHGIPEEFAQKVMLAIAGGKVTDAQIKY